MNNKASWETKGKIISQGVFYIDPEKILDSSSEDRGTNLNKVSEMDINFKSRKVDSNIKKLSKDFITAGTAISMAAKELVFSFLRKEATKKIEQYKQELDELNNGPKISTKIEDMPESLKQIIYINAVKKIFNLAESNIAMGKDVKDEHLGKFIHILDKIRNKEDSYSSKINKISIDNSIGNERIKEIVRLPYIKSLDSKMYYKSISLLNHFLDNYSNKKISDDDLRRRLKELINYLDEKEEEILRSDNFNKEVNNNNIGAENNHSIDKIKRTMIDIKTIHDKYSTLFEIFTKLNSNVVQFKRSILGK